MVDELCLRIYPVLIGAGERLFGETSHKNPMRIVSIRIVNDLAALTLETV